MKSNLLRRMAAASLSAVMAVSVLSLESPADVSAKAPYVKLNTTFKTLTAGQMYKLKLKNNTLNWKVNKAVSKDSTVCKAVNKKSYVKLTAKKEGRTTIQVTLRTAKRKGSSAEKKLSCRVNVKAASLADPNVSDIPDTEKTDTSEIKASETVATQAELENALADKNLKSIMIKTSSDETFFIAEGKYDEVDLVVDAAASDVVNYGVFKSVTVKAIKDSTWTENAKGNSMKVEAPRARIIVEEGASVAAVSCSYMNAIVKLEVRGSIGAVRINTKLNIELSGITKIQVPVVLEESAKDAEVNAKIPVNITVNTDASVIFDKGAEKSTIQVASNVSTVKVKNNTAERISVKRANDTIQSIPANGGSGVVRPSGSSLGGNVSSGAGSFGSSGSTSQGTLSGKLAVNLNKDTYTYGDPLPVPEVMLNDRKVENCTIKYYKDGETNEITNGKEPLPAGKYKVTAAYNNDRYRGEKSFTVEPKSLTPILTGYVVKEFDGNTSVPQENNLKILLNNIVGSDDVSASAEYTYASADGGSKKTVNAVNITLFGEAKDNYTLDNAEAKADIGIIDKTPVKVKMKVNVETFTTGSAVRVLDIDPCDKTGESYFHVPDWTNCIMISGQQVRVGTAAELQNLLDAVFDIQITTAYTKKIYEGSLTQALTEGERNIEIELKEVDMKLSQVELNVRAEGSIVRIIWTLPQGECGQEYPYRKWSGSERINGQQILPGLTGTTVELDNLSDIRFDVEVTSEHTKETYMGNAVRSLKEGEQIVIIEL